MTSNEAFRSRKIIESLRCGVPSATTVQAMGSGQRDIEAGYLSLLDRLRRRQPGGMLVGGGFGTGKSHLLWQLAHQAGQERFVVSRIVVSKETPLSDPVKVAYAALGNATATGQCGPVLPAIIESMDVRGPSFLALQRSAEAGLDPRFAATVAMYARLRDRDDYANRIARFWCGDPLPTVELRRKLRGVGGRGAIGPVRPAELATQRMRFAADLIVAGGYDGWILLFDEVELIGRYPLAARCKAYAELARWFIGDIGGRPAPFGAVLAITDDFVAAVIDGKGDRERLARRFAAVNDPDQVQLGRRAALGIRIVEDRMVRLVPPDSRSLARIYHQAKRLHADAYDWKPRDVRGIRDDGRNPLRRHIRAWINEWDLVRMDPAYRPTTRIDPLEFDYSEA